MTETSTEPNLQPGHEAILLYGNKRFKVRILEVNVAGGQTNIG